MCRDNLIVSEAGQALRPLHRSSGTAISAGMMRYVATSSGVATKLRRAVT